MFVKAMCTQGVTISLRQSGMGWTGQSESNIGKQVLHQAGES